MFLHPLRNEPEMGKFHWNASGIGDNSDWVQTQTGLTIIVYMMRKMFEEDFTINLMNTKILGAGESLQENSLTIVPCLKDELVTEILNKGCIIMSQLSGFLKMNIWRNKEKNLVVIDCKITDYFNTETINHIITVLPKIFSWKFQQLSEEEQSEVVDFQMKWKDDPATAISTYMNGDNRYHIVAKELIDKAFEGMRERTGEALQAQITQTKNSIYDWSNRITEARKLLRETEWKLSGFLAGRDDGTAEVKDFLLHTRNIKIVPSNRNGIVFHAFSTFDIDEDKERDVRLNVSRWLARNCGCHGEYWSEAVWRNVLERLWNPDKTTVHSCAEFIWDNASMHIVPTKGLVIDNDHYPNPHYYKYSCMGENGPEMNKLFGTGDYINGFQLCICATGWVNPLETGATYEPFFGLMMGWENIKGIEDKKSGKRYSLYEFVKAVSKMDTDGE